MNKLQVMSVILSLMFATIAKAALENEDHTIFCKTKLGFKYFRSEWKCDFDSSINYPRYIPIYFGYNRDSKELDYCDFKTIIKQAEAQYPHVDFGKCLKTSLSGFFYQMTSSEEFENVPYEILKKSFQKAETDLAIYKSNADKRANLESLNLKSGNDFQQKIPFYIKSVISNCTNFIDDINILDFSFIKALGKAKSQIPNSCIIKLTNKYAEIILAKLPSLEICDKYTRFCNDRYEKVAVVLDELSKAGYAQYFDRSKTNIDIAAIPFIIRDVINKKSLAGNVCVDLKENTNQNIYAKYSPVTSKYTLSRLNDRILNEDYLNFYNKKIEKNTKAKVFKATINAKFTLVSKEIIVKGDKSKIEKITNDDSAKINNEWINKINTCLTSIAPRLRGTNGDYLEIEYISKPKNGNYETYINIIKSSQWIRSNSSNWWSGVNCSTITHETLHTLGLVDVYNEKESGRKIKDGVLETIETKAEYLDYDCRAKGPLDDIMNQQWTAFDSANPSLLHPAEFRAITEPGCESNKYYYLCSEDAYNTSAANFGSGCLKNLPQICKSKNYLWLY